MTARLDEFDQDEWRDVAKALGMSGERFEKAWKEFQREKARVMAKRALQ